MTVPPSEHVSSGPGGAERLAAQRRAQRSGASPLQPRVRRELVDEPGHGWTIRLRRAAVQRAGACVARKPLRRKGRALLRRDLGRRRPGRNGCTMRVRAATRVVACPAPHISRVSPNVSKLSGERPPAGRTRVRCSALLGGLISCSYSRPTVQLLARANRAREVYVARSSLSGPHRKPDPVHEGSLDAGTSSPPVRPSLSRNNAIWFGDGHTDHVSELPHGLKSFSSKPRSQKPLYVLTSPYRSGVRSRSAPGGIRRKATPTKG